MCKFFDLLYHNVLSKRGRAMSSAIHGSRTSNLQRFAAGLTSQRNPRRQPDSALWDLHELHSLAQLFIVAKHAINSPSVLHVKIDGGSRPKIRALQSVLSHCIPDALQVDYCLISPKEHSDQVLSTEDLGFDLAFDPATEDYRSWPRSNQAPLVISPTDPLLRLTLSDMVFLLPTNETPAQRDERLIRFVRTAWFILVWSQETNEDLVERLLSYSQNCRFPPLLFAFSEDASIVSLSSSKGTVPLPPNLRRELGFT